MNYKELYQKIHNTATDAAYDKHGENVMIYPCGFAAINFEKLGKNETICI